MSWHSVRNNAETQREFFSHLPPGSGAIESYYPELHGPRLAGQFVNAAGGLVIADLLTAPHIIVDLYPCDAEAELISRYGVDLKFLLALRDRGLVTLAANADLDAYHECTWMHDLLADERTLFRSVRTPLFFTSIYPDIAETRQLWKSYLERRFREMTSGEFDTFVAHMLHYQKATPESLARQLSWEWARIEALSNRMTSSDRTEESVPDTYSIDDILKRPDEWLRILYRDFLLLVSPHSGALGGSIRIPRDQIEQWFPEAAGDPALLDLSKFQELHEFLLAIGPKVSTAEVSGEQYWMSLSRMQRHELLELLTAVDERKQLMLTERNLRERIGNLDRSVQMEEIHDFVQKDIKVVKKFESVGDIAYNLVCTGFGAAIDMHLNWFGGVGGAAAGFETGRMLKGKIIKSRAKSVLEFAWPRVQVANFVRARKT